MRPIVRERRGWLFVAFAIWLVIGFAPILPLIPMAVLRHGVFPYLLGAAFLAYPAVLFALGRAWTSRLREGRRDARADEQGLWLAGKLVWKRSAIRHARVEGEWLHLRDRLRATSIALGDDAPTWLAAMRLDPERSVARFAMLSGSKRRAAVDVLASLVGYLVAGGLLFGGAGVAAFAVMILTALAAVVVGVRTLTRVEVGADGVRFARRLARARFVPFGAIDRVDAVGESVRFVLRSGEVIVVRRPEPKIAALAVDASPDERAALVERVRVQLDRHRARGDGGALARGGRSTAKWLEDLEQIGQPATFRTPAIPPDVLWRIVEDATAETTARAGAAYALRDALDAPGRERIRVLADACAAPRLRVALEGIAGEPVDVLAAFESLADEERADDARRRARRHTG